MWSDISLWIPTLSREEMPRLPTYRRANRTRSPQKVARVFTTDRDGLWIFFAVVLVIVVDLAANLAAGARHLCLLRGVVRPEGLEPASAEQRETLRAWGRPRRDQLAKSELVRPEGLEPPAYWFEASRSIQLSYGR
jgi:hypothetical protein